MDRFPHSPFLGLGVEIWGPGLAAYSTVKVDKGDRVKVLIERFYRPLRDRSGWRPGL